MKANLAVLKQAVLVLVIGLITTLLSPVVWAGNTDAEHIVLPPDSLPHEIGGQFQYLVDPDAERDITSVRSAGDEHWQGIESANPNFGFTDNVYWFRAEIVETSAQQRDWLLELGYPLLDHVDVYFFQQGRLIEHYVTGDRKPFSQRPVIHRNFLFPLTLSENESVTVYVRIETSSAVQMPMSLTTRDQLLQSEQPLLAAHGLYFGAIAIMLIYNLCILFSTRDKPYLIYVMLVLAIGGFQLSLHGFAYQFFWPESPWLQDKMTGMFVAAGSLFCAWFTISFLNVRAYSTWLFWTLAVVAAGSAALTLLAPFASYQFTIRLSAALALASVLVAQVTGFYIWYRGYKPAIFYSIAFAALLTGSAMMILNKFGLLPLNFLTENGQQIGSLAQVVLLSFALAYRIKVLRDATEEAQLEATSRLEDRVRERTLELQEANEKLKQLSSRDALTGTLNRRYFTDQLVIEWNRARREQCPTSLIMLDIDHFKVFNDTYGHQAGDDCLRFLVQHLQASVFRPSDVVVRYGGEEFALVLPSTDERGAVTVAERIKTRLDAQAFPLGDEAIPITVSQGIATMVPQVGDEPDDLIHQADQALYKAKDAGRDCYLVYKEDAGEASPPSRE